MKIEEAMVYLLATSQQRHNISGGILFYWDEDSPFDYRVGNVFVDFKFGFNKNNCIAMPIMQLNPKIWRRCSNK